MNNINRQMHRYAMCSNYTLEYCNYWLIIQRLSLSPSKKTSL